MVYPDHVKVHFNFFPSISLELPEEKEENCPLHEGVADLQRQSSFSAQSMADDDGGEQRLIIMKLHIRCTAHNEMPRTMEVPLRTTKSAANGLSFANSRLCIAEYLTKRKPLNNSTVSVSPSAL